MSKWLIVLAAWIFVASTAFSCRQDVEAVETKDNLGVVVKKQPIWQVANTTDSNNPGGNVVYSKIVSDGILDTYSYNSEKNKYKLVLLDLTTGKRKWAWEDVLRDFETVHMSRGNMHLFDNYLFYNYGPRNYCIDSRTGQTIWKQVTGYSAFPNCASLGSVYFTKGTPLALNDQGTVEDRVYRGDIRTGKEVEVVMPRYSRQNIRTAASWSRYVGLISDVNPVVEGQDTLLLMVYNETGPGRNEFQACTGLYNMSRRQWVYERVRIKDDFPEAVNTSWLTIVGDKMFTILNNAVACSNWRTGELIWFRPLPSFAAIPTPIEDKYLAVFSTDSRLFLLDIHTGQTLWQMRETLNTTSQVYYDQGILYYLTATLNAVEIPSGRKLWSIESPTSGKLDGSFWGFITGLPGKNGRKGRIFTRTGYHTYCFEAIK